MKKDELILIVDDNLGFIDRVVSMLEDSVDRNNINIASNYDEAKRIFLREDHRVVLLDINLPGKNGIDLLRLFKETKKETEVIMITNHADSYYRQQCMELGAEYFLDKSHDFTLLPGIINKKLAG
jgi:DNA-binding NarL/FixJ family response regulator